MVKPSERETIVPLKSDRQRGLEVQREIERLQRHCLVELEAVQQFHTGLDDKRSCRQACRVIGDSRTL